MLIKFLRHGRGSGHRAVKYLLARNDHANRQRAVVRVLRGHPKLTARLIDSLQFDERYSSCVIAFAPEDQPTPEQIEQLLNEFQTLAFAGLQIGQYDFLAVLHGEHNGNCHIHILVPRVELRSGRSMNIAPPGWQTTFDALRDAWNTEQNWAQPGDPTRRRPVQPGVLALSESPHPKEMLTNWLLQLVQAGTVTDRTDVISALSKLGEVTRQGDDYLSLRLQPGHKPLRLKGTLYERRFTAAEFRSEQKASGNPECDPAANQRAKQEHVDEARARLARACERRARYHQERYPVSPVTDDRTTKQKHRPPAQAASAVLVDSDPINPGLVLVDPRGSSGLGNLDRAPGGRGGERETSDHPTTGAALLRQPGRPRLLPKGSLSHERDRSTVAQAIRKARAALRRATRRIERSLDQLGAAAQHAVSAAQQLVRRIASAVIQQTAESKTMNEAPTQAGLPAVVARERLERLKLKKTQLQEQAAKVLRPKPRLSAFCESAADTEEMCRVTAGVWIEAETEEFQLDFQSLTAELDSLHNQQYHLKKSGNGSRNAMALGAVNMRIKDAEDRVSTLILSSEKFKADRTRLEAEARVRWSKEVADWSVHAQELADAKARLVQIDPEIAEASIAAQAEEQAELNWRVLHTNFALAEVLPVLQEPPAPAVQAVPRPAA